MTGQSVPTSSSSCFFRSLSKEPTGLGSQGRGEQQIVGLRGNRDSGLNEHRRHLLLLVVFYAMLGCAGKAGFI